MCSGGQLCCWAGLSLSQPAPSLRSCGACCETFLPPHTQSHAQILRPQLLSNPSVVQLKTDHCCNLTVEKGFASVIVAISIYITVDPLASQRIDPSPPLRVNSTANSRRPIKPRDTLLRQGSLFAPDSLVPSKLTLPLPTSLVAPFVLRRDSGARAAYNIAGIPEDPGRSSLSIRPHLVDPRCFVLLLVSSPAAQLPFLRR